MKQPYFLSDLAESDVEMRILYLSKYGIPPKLDDSDRLRAYLVIMDFEDKAKDKSDWVLGFLLCASIWTLQANGWPFAWTSEIFNLFGWSRNTIVLCNLALLIAFWIGVFLFVTSQRERAMLPWQASDEELGDLAKRIREMRRARELRGS